MDLEPEDECPYCQFGTLELVEDGSLVCRGECGEFFQPTGETKMPKTPPKKEKTKEQKKQRNRRKRDRQKLRKNASKRAANR